MGMVPRILDILAVLSAFAAAGLWGWASFMNIPNPRAYYDHTPDHDPFVVAFKRASRINAIAAINAGASAVFGAVKLAFF
ncbi:hypothetical protein [Tardiphaga sp. P5_C7]